MPAATTSDIYVWAWLPGSTEPVVAGLLDGALDNLRFGYARSYRNRSDAIPLAPTLPLGEEVFPATEDFGMPAALRDAAPDAWGRRVIAATITGKRGKDLDVDAISTVDYLLRSGSDRLGAIDFQESRRTYVARESTDTLDDLHEAAMLLDDGRALPDGLAAALQRGTSLGGAAPKATLRDGRGGEFLAKFSTAGATIPVVKAEAASISLARRAGIEVPEARLVRSLGKDVLVVDRFDRDGAGGRRFVVSGLTLSGLGEMSGRHGTYLEFAAKLQEHGADVRSELYRRIALNMAISNTDDHLRNHAAFWDGSELRLTPAYDLSPMERSWDANQAIAYGLDGRRRNNLALLLEVGSEYGLTQRESHAAIDEVVAAVHDGWEDAAEFAQMGASERSTLWGQQFLHPATVEGLPHAIAPGFVAGPEPT